jgi:uncharacterized protein YjbI with pentapeptide repeats
MKKTAMLLVTGGLMAAQLSFADVQANVSLLLKTKQCSGCSLVNVLIEGQNLDGANFENTDLHDATFTVKEWLVGAGESDSQNTSLKGANFKGANLKNVQFNKVDLSNAHFEGATFDYRTEFIDCKLDGAKMSANALMVKDAKGKTVKVKGAFNFVGKPKFTNIDSPAQKK